MDTAGNSAASRDKAYLMHPMTNLKRHLEIEPTVVTGGKGIYVYDDAGKEYIEGLAGLWCTSLGFGEERLVEAAARQMRQLPYYHQFRGMGHHVGIDLAEKLLSIAPAGMSKVFFANSGSEANDTILKLIWYYNNALGRPQKKKVIARIKGYHGTTLAAASLSGLPHMHKAFDLPMPGILHTDCPHYYRFGKDGESEEEFATRMADSLEQLILKEGPDTVAAFFAEPIMGAGGVITPPKTYFEKVQAVLKKYDVLFVADEVICGFGRTGKMFATETYDLKPDFITVAKALSSAYLPISGVMMTQEVFDGISRQSGELGVLGHRLQDGMRKFASHPLVGEVRGIGLIGAIELVKDKATHESFDVKDGIGAYCQDRAQEHGLITRGMGDSLAFCPPLIITAAEIDEMLSRFGKALDDTAAMVDQKKLAKVA